MLLFSLLSVGFLAVAPLDGQATAADELFARLARLPQHTHNSEIRADRDPRTGGIRVWIDANEDDTRLYTPLGGQMDIDFQPSYVLVGDSLPSTVTLRIDTRGTATPGPGPRTLTLVANGRPVTLTQREDDASTSGPLLFLSMEARIPLEEFLTLVTASRVEGRVWGIPFALLDSQLELLRAFAARMRPA